MILNKKAPGMILKMTAKDDQSGYGIARLEKVIGFSMSDESLASS